MFPVFFWSDSYTWHLFEKQVTTYSKRKAVGKKDPWVFNLTFEELKMMVKNMFLVKVDIFGVKLFFKNHS